MKKFCSLDYNHSLLEKQLEEGLLKIDSGYTDYIKCTGMHCPDCAFYDCTVDLVMKCVFTGYWVRDDEVFKRFKEEYPEEFI